jgi:hypothetical protein
MSMKNYLVAGFNLADPETLARYCGRGDHQVEKVAQTTLEDDLYANVENAANVKLTDRDTVYIDRFGRVNGFVQEGRHYVIAYS